MRKLMYFNNVSERFHQKLQSGVTVLICLSLVQLQTMALLTTEMPEQLHQGLLLLYEVDWTNCYICHGHGGGDTCLRSYSVKELTGPNGWGEGWVQSLIRRNINTSQAILVKRSIYTALVSILAVQPHSS